MPVETRLGRKRLRGRELRSTSNISTVSSSKTLGSSKSNNKSRHEMVVKVYKCAKWESFGHKTRSNTGYLGYNESDFNLGGKVYLPQDMLDTVLDAHPHGMPKNRAMVFSLKNLNDASTDQINAEIQNPVKLINDGGGHRNDEVVCGVRQFNAPPQTIVLPKWMFDKLRIQPLEKIEVRLLCCPTIPYANAMKLKSNSKDLSIVLSDIEVRKRVLGVSLRRYSAVKIHDNILIDYNGRIHHLTVLDAKPCDCVDITECDIDISLDLTNKTDGTENKNMNKETHSNENDCMDYYEKNKCADSPHGRGTPDEEWKIGTLHFTRSLNENNQLHVFSNTEIEFNRDILNNDNEVVDVEETRKRRLQYFDKCTKIE